MVLIQENRIMPRAVDLKGSQTRSVRSSPAWLVDAPGPTDTELRWTQAAVAAR